MYATIFAESATNVNSFGLPWPLAMLDIEASSLDQDSYPIEVGVAVWPAPNAPIAGWSTLILPTEHWLRHGHRSRKASALHLIPDAELLAQGRPPAQAAAMLNVALEQTAVAWCDGGDYDLYWLDRLFAASGLKIGFEIGDWRSLVARLSDPARERVTDFRKRQPSHHRALRDAVGLLEAIAYALDISLPQAATLNRNFSEIDICIEGRSSGAISGFVTSTLRSPPQGFKRK